MRAAEEADWLKRISSSIVAASPRGTSNVRPASEAVYMWTHWSLQPERMYSEAFPLRVRMVKRRPPSVKAVNAWPFLTICVHVALAATVAPSAVRSFGSAQARNGGVPVGLGVPVGTAVAVGVGDDVGV